MKKNRANLILIAGLLLIVCALTVQLRPWEKLIDAETKAWRLTLVGKDGNEQQLGYKDIAKMPSHTANAGFFSTVGLVFGPVDVKGVRLAELCEAAGGLEPTDAVMISARDGYSTVLSYEQVMGDFVAYTTELKEVPGIELTTLLVYQMEGKPLDHEVGKPMRLAVVGSKDGYLTEGNYWVKWVDRIEVLTTR